MKVAVVAASGVPFVVGGAERLWSGLVRAVNERTPHDCDLIKLPVDEHTLPGLVAGYAAFARLDLSHFDVVVTTKYPAWAARHARHVLYLQHRLRGLYDTYPAELDAVYGGREPELADLRRLLAGPAIPETADELFDVFPRAIAALGADHAAFHLPGPLARQVVHFLDEAALAPPAVHRYLAISRTVAGRAGYFPTGVPVRAVHHPSDLTGFRCGRHDYLFTASRLDAPKRVELLAEAMRALPRGIPLKIAGDGPERGRLQAYADEDPRIELLGYVSNSYLLDLYADALAVPFVPLDEDLGLITLEAMCSGKPVVTTHDSGGAIELVAHGLNGLVVEATPRALAAAFEELAAHPGRARAMGRSAQVSAARVTWDEVLDALLGRATVEPAATSGTSRLAPSAAAATTDATSPAPDPAATDGRYVVASTFPIHPRAGGGQLRSCHLYRDRVGGAEVRVVSLTGPGESLREVVMADRFVETVVPKTTEHESREQALRRRVGVPVTDIAATMFIADTPAYLSALAEASETAAAAVLAHPFMFPALREVAPGLPFVYDAHNVEVDLKRTMLPETPEGARLLEVVRTVEASAVDEAVLVVTCSQPDAEALQRLYGAPPGKFVVVPNGVDAQDVPFTPWDARAAIREAWLARYSALAGRSFRHLALFTGSLHVPNVEAARSVMEAAVSLPDVLFALVGRHSDAFWDWRLPPNVALLGVVSDDEKSALLRAADVALNPMAHGSGTNLKLFEYMAAGVPVVSSPHGARGVDAEPGRYLYVTPLEELASGIDAALADPAAPELALRARELVEDRYDWGPLSARLWEAIRQAG